jgi:hypothetical protein
MSKKTYVKPVIQDGQIISIEIQDVSLPIKGSLSLNELPQLVDAVEKFFKYVDIERFGEALTREEELKEWDDENLRKFVTTQLRDSQSVALEILAESDEVTREQFLDRMKKRLGDEKFRGWSLGGLLAGITMKSKSWGYESPYVSDWKTVGSEWRCFYNLTRETYRPIIREALKEREA